MDITTRVAPDDAAVDPAPRVLAALRQRQAVATQVEVDKLRLALEWAELHPGQPVDPAVPWEERPLELAGDGAPTVAEFCIAELALALDMSTDSGRRYVGDAVELRYRLPRLWRRTVEGDVLVWRARRVAQATRSLPVEGAAYVDAHLAPVGHSCSAAQLERTVERARALFDPEEAEHRRVDAAESRFLDIRLGDAAARGTTGTVHVEGCLDLADALALEAAIAGSARELADSHPDLPLDVRRSMAAGLLAGGTSGSADGRELVIHLHHQVTETHGVVDVDGTRSVVTAEQLAEWCQAAGTRVTLRPVLDLDAELTTDGYHPTAAQREQVVLTHRTCVFPGCTRPSRGCDLDHVVAWERGGETTSWNLAPLCRGHHRLKTHGGWGYVRTSRTTFLWTSPHGSRHAVRSERHIR